MNENLTNPKAQLAKIVGKDEYMEQIHIHLKSSADSPVFYGAS